MSERSNVKQKGRLHFTVGLAASGKSTFVNEWVRYEVGPGPGVQFRPRVAVGGDDFRLAAYGQEYWPGGEGVAFACMDVAIRALLGRGFDVMVDETCTTQSTLLRYLKIDPEAVAHFIETPAEVCIERARANGRPYLEGPIRRMDAQLKELRKDWDDTVEKLRGYVEQRRGLDVMV